MNDGAAKNHETERKAVFIFERYSQTWSRSILVWKAVRRIEFEHCDRGWACRWDWGLQPSSILQNVSGGKRRCYFIISTPVHAPPYSTSVKDVARGRADLTVIPVHLYEFQCRYGWKTNKVRGTLRARTATNNTPSRLIRYSWDCLLLTGIFCEIRQSPLSKLQFQSSWHVYYFP
jgi:hypothetical protein